MPVCYVEEFFSAVSVIGTTAPAVMPAPALAVQPLTISGASNSSAAFGATTKAVVLVSDTLCHFRFGDNNGGAAVATANDQYLPANVPRIFAVSPGQKVAVF